MSPLNRQDIARGLWQIVRHPRASRAEVRNSLGRFAGPREGVVVSLTIRCENREYLRRLMDELTKLRPNDPPPTPFSTAERISTALVWEDTDIETALDRTPPAFRRVAALARVPFDEITLESITARAIGADVDTDWIDDLQRTAAEVRSPDVEVRDLHNAAEELAEGVHRLFRESRIDRSGSRSEA